ncbi:MAG: PTS transporter subunit EIIC [Lachnospiraceae bacterium]|nr:PTS transporter subunit EIIC [Lachnospiraceae bacterium]
METSKKPGLYKRVVDQISGIFVPIINYLTAASIIKSVILLLVGAGVLSKDDGLYMVFYAVSDGFFYFLPFFLAITASKQWKTDMYIALLIPVAMLYPDLIDVLENGRSLPFLAFDIQPAVYHSSVIPVILGVGLLYFVEKPFDKILPDAIKGFLKPIFCCIIVLPVTFLLFGPLGTWIGDFLTYLFRQLYQWNHVAAGVFMGFIIQPMVFIGAHWSIVPISIASIAADGFDLLLPLLGGAVYGQCGAALAIAFMHKDKKQRNIAFQAALSSALGVTEPALFGVTMKRPRAMISACVAGAVGGAIAGMAGSQCITFAFPSFVTSVAYTGEGFGMFLVSMLIAFPIGFGLTYIQKKAIINQIQADNNKKD